MIYKVLRPAEWSELVQNGASTGAPIDMADGYIHFSTATQVAETLAKHFAGMTPLIIAAVDDAGLGDALKWEVSRGDALFPHLYRALKITDIAQHGEISVVDGTHVLPDWVA